MFSVKNKTAVMTGAARGPGLAFAKVLAENRANLAVLDIVPPDQPLERMKTDYGMRVKYYKANARNLTR